VIGQFDSFGGGLNLVADPRNRLTFGLDQTPSMDGCDTTTGALKPLSDYWQVVAHGPIASLYWTGTRWINALHPRSYVRLGQLTGWSVDDATVAPNAYETFENSFEDITPLGIDPPDRALLEAVNPQKDNCYIFQFEEQSLLTQYLEGQDWQSGGFEVFRQKVTFVSASAITDIRIGHTVANAPGLLASPTTAGCPAGTDRNSFSETACMRSATSRSPSAVPTPWPTTGLARAT
jgi:hypothetical protein